MSVAFSFRNPVADSFPFFLQPLKVAVRKGLKELQGDRAAPRVAALLQAPLLPWLQHHSKEQTRLSWGVLPNPPNAVWAARGTRAGAPKAPRSHSCPWGTPAASSTERWRWA